MRLLYLAAMTLAVATCGSPPDGCGSKRGAAVRACSATCDGRGGVRAADSKLRAKLGGDRCILVCVCGDGVTRWHPGYGDWRTVR